MLITGAVTLVTWLVTFVTCLYMHKKVARLLDRTLLEIVSRSAFHLTVFQSNKIVNEWACTCYEKYPFGVMKVPLGTFITP